MNYVGGKSCFREENTCKIYVILKIKLPLYLYTRKVIQVTGE